MIYWAKISSRN